MMVTDYKVIKCLISTPLSKKIFFQMTKTVRILNTILLKTKMSKKKQPKKPIPQNMSFYNLSNC